MRFSVVIPVYNVMEYLEKCVRSVLDQTCSDYEIVLVDDGSTDDSGTLCDTIAAKTPDKIRVIHQENGGLGAARNTGLEHADGEFLVFLDSDDYIAPNMLEELSKKMDAMPADIYTFGFRTDKNGDTSAVFVDGLPEDRVFTLADTPELLLALPNAWTRIYRTKLFLDTGIRYPSRVWYEDIRTTTKLFAQAKGIAAVNQPFYYYVIRDGSIMNNSKIARNHEIIDAFDDVLGYYREHGLFERYRDELCRMTIDHVLIAASVRVLRADPKHPLLKEFYQYTQKNFPDFAQNKYIQQLPKSKRLAYELVRRKHYRTLALLFRIKK